MATKKKKDQLIKSSDLAEMQTDKNSNWPRIEKGSHLTVTTFEDGHTELLWDDEALAREVREAIASVEAAEPKKIKSRGKKKENA